jgi:hypothetical protein
MSRKDPPARLKLRPRQRAKTTPTLRPDGLSARERFCAIIEEFTAQAGQTSEVARALQERFKDRFPNQKWSRESIYAELRAGIVSGYVEVKTLRSDLGTRLLERHGLKSAEVITSLNIEHVAELGARQLIGLFHNFRSQRICSVGFASGSSMSRVVRALALLIPNSELDFPERLRFHALSSSFNVENLKHDASFFLARLDEPTIRERFPGGVEFIGLHSPSLAVNDPHGVLLARQKAQELDIVVSGASDIGDPNAALSKFFERNENERRRLQELGCEGHLLYLPLGPDGPTQLSDQMHRMPTALDLSDLQKLVQQGKRVMLISGPRYRTFEPKRIVATILGQNLRIVTDIVIDEITAKYAEEHTRLGAGSAGRAPQSAYGIPHARAEG